MKPDLFIAGFLLLASSAVAVSAYRALEQVERPKQEILQTIEIGKHEHFVVHGGECIGNFVTTFQVKPETTLISKGELRFRYQDRPIVAKLFVGSFFNMLNQLVAMNATLETENAKIDVNVTNTAPINVVLKLQIDGRLMERSFALPGPVVLQKNVGDSYRIDFTALRALAAGYSQPLQALPLGSVPFDVVSRTNEPQFCVGAENQKAFVLDPMAVQVQTFLNQWQSTGLLH